MKLPSVKGTPTLIIRISWGDHNDGHEFQDGHYIRLVDIVRRISVDGQRRPEWIMAKKADFRGNGQQNSIARQDAPLHRQPAGERFEELEIRTYWPTGPDL